MLQFMILAADTSSIGERLATAGRNTLICICVVFVILIFMSLVISLFKFINKAESAIAAKKEAKAEDKNIPIASVDNAVAQIEERETNELELVAVIAAAIAASENISTDDFVVRSIRRIKR